jgi:probable phosphomutase (TIGR03848 family)
VPSVVLVRHGRSTANVAGVLTGRAPGVSLDEVGRSQAAGVAERLAGVSLVAVVSSPLERCRETATIIADGRGHEVRLEDGLTECDYGQWQGRPLGELAQEPLWTVVQNEPSAAVFPDGESLTDMQARAVDAVRRHDAAVEAEHGSGAVWVAVTHGDVIKSLLADALGLSLDRFQRIVVNPGSVSVVRYGSTRPAVVATNTDAGDLAWLRGLGPADDAPVGGGAGPDDAAADS